MFKPPAIWYADGYKLGHRRMLAKGTTKLYGTWIPRSVKYAPGNIKKIVSFGQQLVMRWLHDEYAENFFALPKESAVKFGMDISAYLGMPYDASHFEALHDLQYLPVRVKSLPEGIETLPNIPHMTFVNTVDGFAWLTLYLETIISSLAWKPSTSATIALQYRRNLVEWVMKTDSKNAWLIDYMAHDFSARGLSPWDMLSSGLGHASSHKGSDTIIVIPAARYFYDEPENQVCISSVNASEHSVSTTKIFTVGEQQMIADWLQDFPTGILSIVADTFDLWTLITKYLPANKDAIMARDGKLVIRPDSGDPVDIICGEFEPYRVIKKEDINKPFILPEGEKFIFLEDKNTKYYTKTKDGFVDYVYQPKHKGVIELLWEIFGGTVNEQGYKVLDPHIGAIYGDSITLDRQVEIYKCLEAKGFAATNIVLGVGSYTYQYNTRDTFGFAAKGAWFEADGKEYDIYKDPVTDNGTKKSLKGLVAVFEEDREYAVKTQCTHEEEATGLLHTIYEDGKFYNQTTLTEIRQRIASIS